MAGKREAGTIFISLQLATKDLAKGVQGVEAQFSKLSTQAQRMGQRLSLALTLPLAAMGRSAVKSFGDFDQAMNNSMAFMGKAGRAMEKELAAGALEIARTTERGAAKAAEGYGTLAQAGYSAAQSLKALPIVVDFATVAQIDLASATEKLVQVQTSLGLAVEDPTQNLKNLTRVADVLARASLDSTAKVDDLATALASQLGGALRLANVDIETATALLEVFAQQGIKGAKAGTSLAIVVRELGIDYAKYSDAFKKLKIDVFDPDTGNYKDTIGIIKDLGKSFKDTADLERIIDIQTLGFTKRNIGLVQALMDMGPAAEIFREKLRGAKGSIESISAQMRAGFNMQLQIAKNKIENLAIVIGADLGPALLGALGYIESLVKLFTDLPGWVRHTAEAILVLGAAIGPLTFAFSLWAGGISAIAGLLKMLLGPIGKVVAALAGMGTVAAATTVAIGVGFVAAAAAIYIYWDEIKAATSSFIEWFKSTDIGVLLVAGWILLKEGVAETYTEIINLSDIMYGRLLTGLQDFTYGAKALWGTFKDSALSALQEVQRGFDQYFPYIAKKLEETGYILQQAWQGDGTKGNRGISGSIPSIDLTFDAKKIVAANDALNEQAAAYDRVKKAVDDAAKAVEDAVEAQIIARGAKGAKSVEDILAQRAKESEAANKTAKALENLRSQYEQLADKTLSKDLKQQLEDSMGTIDQNAFNKLREQYAKAVYDGSLAGSEKAVKAAGSSKEAKSLADKMALEKQAQALNELDAQWSKESQDRADKVAADLKEAYTDAVSFYQDIFTRAITKGGFDLKEILKKVAIDFAASLAAGLAASMTGGLLKGVTSLEGLIGKITEGAAQSILGSLTGGSIAAGTSGIGPVLSGQAYGDALGAPAGANALTASEFGAAAGIAMGGVLLAKGFSDLLHGKTDNSAFGLSARVQTGITTGGLSELYRGVGGLLGKFGSKDADTKSRDKAFDFLSEKSGQSFSGVNGSRFKGGGGGFDFLNSLGDRAKGMFSALGEGLRDVLGITEDIGPQIGAILAENLTGNLDKARLMTKSLGISQEDMKNAVIKAGLAMSKTWLEIQGILNGVADAFTPGRAGKGDVIGALEALRATGNQGMEALQALRDVAVEVGELGGKSTADLVAKIAQLGDPTAAQQFAEAMKTFGIKSVEEFAKMSDDMAIAFVAHLQALGFSFEELAGSIDKTTDSVAELTDASSGAEVTTVSSSVTPKKFAKGGILRKPTFFNFAGGFGLGGESGPESLMPLSRMPDGALGVRMLGGKKMGGNTVNITVNAPNATPGMEQVIVAAIENARTSIINGAVNATLDYVGRNPNM